MAIGTLGQEVGSVHVKVGADTSGFEQGIQQVRQQAQGLADSLKQGLSLGAGFAVAQGAFQSLSNALMGLKASVIGVNSELETATQQFKVFMGSAEAAKAHVKDLFDFAKETPFESGPIIQASRMLETFGGAALNTKQNLYLFGDAAAAVSAPFNEVAFWVGRAYSSVQAGRPFGEAAARLQELAIMSPEARNKMEQLQKQGASSSEVWKVLEEDLKRFNGSMKEMANTWAGVTSTFSDNMNMLLAETFRPFFELIKDGIKGVNDLFENEQFKVWAAMAGQAVSGVVDNIRGLIAYLEPLKTIFQQVFAELGSGNIAGAASVIGQQFGDLLNYILTSANEFAASMFGSGYSLIEEYASGITEAGNDLISAAVEGIADVISAFLIGNSPPPEGPLSAIDKGGENVGKAWSDGLTKSVGEGAKAAAEAATHALEGQMDALKDSIRQLDGQLRELDGGIREIKNTMSDLKDSFREQLEPLQEQLDLIKDRNSSLYEEQELQIALQDAELKRAEYIARGSEEVRSRIQLQLDELNQQKEDLQMVFRRTELEKKAIGEITEAEQRLKNLRDRKPAKTDVSGLEEQLRQLRAGGRSSGPREQTAAEAELERLKDEARDTSSRPKTEAEKQLEQLKAQFAAKKSGTADPGLADQKEALDLEEQRLRLKEREEELNQKALSGRNVDFDRAQLELDKQRFAIREQEVAQKKIARAEEAEYQKQLAALEAKVAAEKAQKDQEEETRKRRIYELEIQVRNEKRAADAQDAEDRKKRETEIASIEEKIRQAKRKDQESEKRYRKEVDTAEKAVREQQQADQRKKAEQQLQLNDLELKQLKLKRALAGLVDKNAMAEIKARQEALRQHKESLSLAKQEEDVRARLASLPLQQQIKALKKEQEELLKPLEDRLKLLEKQKQTLQDQKSELAAQRQLLQDQLGDAKKAAKNVQEEAPKVNNKRDKPEEKEDPIQKKAKELADNLKNGILDYIRNNTGTMLAAIAGAIGGWFVLGPVGSVAGALLATSLYKAVTDKLNEVFGEKNVFRQMLEVFIADIQMAFEEDGIAGVLDIFIQAIADAVPAAGAALSNFISTALEWTSVILPALLKDLNTVIDQVLTWIESLAPTIGESLYSWSLQLIGWVQESLPGLLDQLAYLASTMLTWIGENTTYLTGKLVEWATAFIGWIGPKIPELLGQLGQALSTLIEWIGENAGQLADGLGAWAVQFVEWVGPKIGPLIEQLAKMLAQVGAWIFSVAIPETTKKLAQWALAFVEYIVPRIPVILGKLNEWVNEIKRWAQTEGLRILVDGLYVLGEGVVDGFATGIRNTYEFLKGSIRWIATQAIAFWAEMFGADPDDAKAGATFLIAIGEAVITGLIEGISNKVEALTKAIGDIVDGFIQGVKKLFGISSPSTVFKEIGENIVQGLKDGLDNGWNTILKLFMEDFPGLIKTAFGWVGEKLTWVDDLLSIGKAIVQGLKDGIFNLWAGDGGETLSRWLNGMGALITGAVRGEQVTGSINWLYQTGKDLLQGLWEGIESYIGTFKTFLKENFVDRLPEWVRTWLKIESPSKVMYGIGQNIVKGLQQGIINEFPSVEKAWGSIKRVIGIGDWEGRGSELLEKIQMIATSIGGPEFGRIATSIAALETGGGRDMFEDEGTGRGPFQFSTPGQLDAYARHLGMSIEEAGKEAIRNPLEAAEWALKGYLGRAIRGGLEEHPGDIRSAAEYAQRYGQVSIEPQRVRDWYDRLFPGLAEGGIVKSTMGGILARIGEGGRDEAVIPLPTGWESGVGQSRTQTIHVPIYIGDQMIEELWIQGRDLAVRRGRDRIAI